MQGIWLISFCNKQNNSKKWNHFLLQNYFVFVSLLIWKIQCGNYFEKVQWFPTCLSQIGWNPFVWSPRHPWDGHCPKTSPGAVPIPSSQSSAPCPDQGGGRRTWSQEIWAGISYLKNMVTQGFTYKVVEAQRCLLLLEIFVRMWGFIIFSWLGLKAS